MKNSDARYSDYQSQAFTTAEVVYVIGTNSGTKFVSTSTLLLATEDCEIKVNNNENWEYVHKDIYYERVRQIWRITVRRDTADGNLEIWAEGKKAR